MGLAKVGTEPGPSVGCGVRSGQAKLMQGPSNQVAFGHPWCGGKRHTAAGGTASRERQVIGWDRTFPARLATSGTGQKPSLKLALFLFLIPSAAAIQALVYFPKCAAG